MAVRGVYSTEEQKMLDEALRDAKDMAGWVESPDYIADENAIMLLALAVDYWNPLWRDRKYAPKTRWGSVIAPPMFQERFGEKHFSIGPKPDGSSPPPVFVDNIRVGEDWGFFKPVYPGDTFRVRHRSPRVEDITSLDGTGSRMFALVAQDLDHFNQRGELVSTYKLNMRSTVLAGPPPVQSVPKYTYTAAELQYIDEVAACEDIRGANPRYWEDVSVHDRTSPVVLEPTTIMDEVAFSIATMGFPQPQRNVRKQMPWELMQDPVTGTYHSRIEFHFSEEMARLRGYAYPINFLSMTKYVISRLVTNWMGDEGFIRKYSCRQFTPACLGDALIGHGEVIDKFVDKDEHLVVLNIYLESIRGNITDAAVATVRLPSKAFSYSK